MMDIAVWKRSGEDGVNRDGKRRKSVKKQAPPPQPVTLPNSSDTPPENDPASMLDIPPPPPSERKIARRRPSVRAAARAFTPDPESPSTAKRHKPSSAIASSAGHAVRGAGRERSTGPEIAPSASSSRGPAALGSSSSMATRLPGLPRPLSPPPALGSSISARRKSSMGPPTEPFVRKTRKSMSRMGLLPADISDDREVLLPDSETPMIKKNKQLREEQSRRSSLGMRGQRASGSLGRGEISTPHPTVDPAHYYKHIAPTIPEPIRCRHLLVFCAKRSLDDHLAEGKSSGKSRDKGKNRYQGERTSEGDRLVKDIVDAFLARLGKGEVDTNVFPPSGGVQDTAVLGLSLLPHPQNVLNREQEAKAESIIRRCQGEKSTWRSIKQRTRKRQEDVSATLKANAASGRAEDKPDLHGMEDWMVEALSLADEIIADGMGDLANKGEFEDVEFKVDMLHQSTHSAAQYLEQSSRFLDGIFSTLASDLRTRDPARSARTADADGPDPATLLAAATTSTVPASDATSIRGKARTDPINMLRALAAAEQKQQNEEGIAAAKRIQPVSASAMALSVSTTTALTGPMGAAQTPRQAGQTPRRAGALGASTSGPASTAGPSGVRGRIYGRGAAAAE